MDDLLFQQMVNELRFMLQNINETYKGFYKFSILTVVDLDQNNNEEKPLRCVIGYEHVPESEKKEIDGKDA